MSHGGTDSAARRTSGATKGGSEPSSSASVDGAHQTVRDRLLELVAVEALLVGERGEGLLAAQREDELLA